MALAEPSSAEPGLPPRPTSAVDLAADLAEVDAAIAVFSRGTAVRVRLTGSRATDAIEAVTAIAHARALAAGLRAQVEGPAGGTHLILTIAR